MRVRFFPDHPDQPDHGFQDVTMIRHSCERGDHRCLTWLSVPERIVNRLSDWGQARRDPGDRSTWVWLPEARLVLNWSQPNSCTNRGYDVDGVLYCIERSGRTQERYVDVSLWRIQNVLRKLRRCIDPST